ncbi:MAG: radical SAM protein, partial [Desulfobacteraceae bacterium]
MNEYVTLKEVQRFPRLPFEGSLDLTYACNNHCRHCWVRIPPDSVERKKELRFDEITRVADEAKKMGCRKWFISGGEPMFRPDFLDIFDYLTHDSFAYTLNTNGTLITPKIAGLLRRKGAKMVSLYGAGQEVHDHITRNPGSFEASLRGFHYLKEAGAGFIVQIIPMKDNFHQLKKMIELAKTLSPFWRIGVAWLYLSAAGDPKVNREIVRQRLAPAEVIALDQPDLSFEESFVRSYAPECRSQGEADDRLFAACIRERRGFHVNPYGQMSFCAFVRDPALCYDLRQGAFDAAWEIFIPSLMDRVRGGEEYQKHCGTCRLREACRWCPVFGYLEHGRYEAKVEYLCAVAEEKKKFEENWKKNHRRFFESAGITIQVDSDLPILDTSFQIKFKNFEVPGPGAETISIRHHFSLPPLREQDLGRAIYRKPPWAVYRKGGTWIYVGFSPGSNENQVHQVAVFDRDYSHGRIYHPNEEAFLRGDLNALTLFPTDLILLSQVLARKQGGYVHAAGLILEDQGLLFVGHSGAGKSTIVKLMKPKAEILCDDRIALRRWPEGFRIHGTWSHGEVPDVSPGSAPLKAIFF